MVILNGGRTRQHRRDWLRIATWVAVGVLVFLIAFAVTALALTWALLRHLGA